MPTTTNYQPPPAPPVGRLWTNADVCLFHGHATVKRLMKMPGFPKPLPCPMRGRRWRPEDHIASCDSLAGTKPVPATVALAELGVDAYAAKWHLERKAGCHGKKA